MSKTIKLEEERLPQYFEQFTRRFLRDDSPESADIAVLSRDWGAQKEAESVRLRGISFDAREHSLDFELESGDHRLTDSSEVWVLEEDDGFASAIEVIHADGVREVVTLSREEPRNRG